MIKTQMQPFTLTHDDICYRTSTDPPSKNTQNKTAYCSTIPVNRSLRHKTAFVGILMTKKSSTENE